MSDKFTEVWTSDGPALGLWGHVDPEGAIDQLRRSAEYEIERAQAQLTAIEAGDVKVFHQRGPYAQQNRRQVWPAAGRVSA